MNTDEILFRRWLNVIRRLDSAATEFHQGYGIIGMQILVGPDGEPKFWTAPNTTALEPRRVRVTDVIMAITGTSSLILTDETKVD